MVDEHIDCYILASHPMGQRIYFGWQSYFYSVLMACLINAE